MSSKLSDRCLIGRLAGVGGGQRVSGVLSNRSLSEKSAEVGWRHWIGGMLSDRCLIDSQETGLVEDDSHLAVWGVIVDLHVGELRGTGLPALSQTNFSYAVLHDNLTIVKLFQLFPLTGSLGS